MTRVPLFLILLAIGGFNFVGASAFGAPCAALKGLDPDNDRTMDLNEAKNAASQLFDKLDHDKDGTLSSKELRRRLSKKELTAGDPDKDKTLSKEEYLAIVGQRFAAANPDKDGTIDCKELGTKSGKALLRLLK